MSETDLGTLMWIGRHDTRELAAAFQHCQRHAAQIAVRDDLQQALSRPALDVQAVIWARTVRAEECPERLNQFQQRYPNTRLLQLLGELCLGWRGETQHSVWHRVGWNRWQDQLPHWLQGETATLPARSTTGHSVAVIASHYAIAEPLLELAAAAGYTATWAQQPNLNMLRGFDTFWWDDSVASPTSLRAWQHRLADFPEAQHTWLCSIATHRQQTIATEAGVQQIVIKPFEVQQLVQRSQQAHATLRAAA